MCRHIMKVFTKVRILLHDQVWSFPVQPGWAVLCWLDRTSGIMYIFTPCSQWAVTFTTSYVFFVTLSGRMCLKPLLITIESDRHGISTQPPLSIPTDGGEESSLGDVLCAPKKAVRFHLQYSAHDCSEIPKFFPGSWVQESKGTCESVNIFQKKPWHWISRFHF